MSKYQSNKLDINYIVPGMPYYDNMGHDLSYYVCRFFESVADLMSWLGRRLGSGIK